jgi:hypothetical protein
MATDNLSFDIDLNLSERMAAARYLSDTTRATMQFLQAARLTALLLAMLIGFSTVRAAPTDGKATGFETALAHANWQYRIALRTLETRGQKETAAQVQLLREAWHDVIQRFEKNHPAPLHDDTDTALLTDVDTRLIGVLLVIDLGNRDAARAALIQIGDILARWQKRVVPIQK